MNAAQRVMGSVTVVVVLVASGLTGAGVGYAAPAGSQPGPQHRSAGSTGCDGSGDRRTGDDCVTHQALGRAADNVVEAGDLFRVRVGAHRALRGTRLATEVQVRPINTKGTAFTGRWVTIKDLRWTAQRRDVLNVRAPEEIGGYALRVLTTRIPRAAVGAGQVSAAGTWMTATSAPTALAAQQKGCPTTSEDEAIMEFFNQIMFSEDIYIIQIDGDVPLPFDRGYPYPRGTFTLQLSCPPQQSPYFPPSDFRLTLALADGSQSVTCNNGAIVLKKTEIADDANCRNSKCDFTVVLSNKTTGKVYSSTELRLNILPGNDTLIPDLWPATLPPCPDPNFNPCLLAGMCQD